MNLYIYICLIFFGIILFLLWNHKDKFSIGGQNIDLTQIETQCNNNFTETENYADIGINDRYRCCDTINTKLEQNFDLENMRSSIQTDIENLIDRNIDFQNYDDEKKENIKEFIIGCSYRPRSLKSCNRKNAAISPEMYLDLDLIGSHTGYTFNCINPCNDDNPCLNGGTCINNICDCPEGYGGRLCQLSPPTTDPCVPNPCQNDGSCLSVSPTEYRCDCKGAYSGENCEDEDSGLGWWVVAGIGACAAAFYNRPNIQREQVPQSDDEENPTLPDDVDVSVPITAPPSDTEVTPLSTQPQQSTQPQTSFFHGDSSLSGLSGLLRPRPASTLPGDNTIQMDSIQMDQEQGNSNYIPTPGP